MTRFLLRLLLRAFRPASSGAAHPADRTGASAPASAPAETRPETVPAEPVEGDAPGAVDYPVTDLLDLHAFRPEDVASVVEEYLAEARARGLERVRIVHGKGIGVQRAIVRALLARHPAVASFGDAADASGWGATVVILKPGSGDPRASSGAPRRT